MKHAAAEFSVVLLAAGYGKRMLPLTRKTPKPLLKIGHQSLIEHHLLKLAGAGFKHVVINIAHLGEQIQNSLGSGGRFNLEIDYSDEIADGPLETAGGLMKALPLIRSESFLSINADIFTDFPFTDLLCLLCHHQTEGHLVLVKNPEHNKRGDFLIDDNNLLKNRCGRIGNTYSGIAHFHKSLFLNEQSKLEHSNPEELNKAKIALAPLLRQWLMDNKLSASLYHGNWTDVGTPQRLAELNTQFK